MAEGDSLYQLSNPDHWNVIYTGNLTAAPAAPRGYIPIPSFKVPLLLDSYTTAIYATNPDALHNWWLALRVYQVLSTPGLLNNEVEGLTQRVPLGRTTVLQWPRLGEQYQLFIEIPFWHQRMQIYIWQYTGPEGDADQLNLQEMADAMRVDLFRLERRLEVLARSGNF